MTTKQKTCSELVHSACESRLEEIRLMLNPQESDVVLVDDGTLDTVLAIDDEEFRFTPPEIEAESRELEIESLIADNFDSMRETMYDRFHEYGLSFDYVEPGTFTDQDEGYLRFQISWGGPSEEIRFYVSPTQNAGYYGVRPDWHLYRIEFWYLDWFDGACVDITKNDTARAVFDLFNECGSVHAAIIENQ